MTDGYAPLRTVRHKASGLRVTRGQVARYGALTPGARAEFLTRLVLLRKGLEDGVIASSPPATDWDLFELCILRLEPEKIR